MKGLDNELYIALLIISNVIAILQLLALIKWPRLARLSFFLLFAWASWINWKTALQTPGNYLEYADLTWISWYASFIKGWFAQHILLAIGFIATSQALIAVSMLFSVSSACVLCGVPPNVSTWEYNSEAYCLFSCASESTVLRISLSVILTESFS